MMEIANIVTTSNINVGPEFKVVPTVDDIIFKEIPTLIIGYGAICELYGAENINILKRNVTNKVFWTFARGEKRDIYDSDIEDFIRHAYKQYINNIKYVDLDIIQYKYRKLMYIVRKLLSLKDVIAYETNNNVIYIYSDNIIFGIDLGLLEYAGVNIVKVRDKIKDRSLVFLEGNEILMEYGNHLDRFDNDVKLIPFLYFINPHK
jgi:hypothetical protein